jgi:hypothetical protein
LIDVGAQGSIYFVCINMYVAKMKAAGDCPTVKKGARKRAYAGPGVKHCANRLVAWRKQRRHKPRHRRRCHELSERGLLFERDSRCYFPANAIGVVEKLNRHILLFFANHLGA